LGNKLPYKKIIDTKLIDYYFSESFKIKTSLYMKDEFYGTDNSAVGFVLSKNPIYLDRSFN
jgi:hypothetical protein